MLRPVCKAVPVLCVYSATGGVYCITVFCVGFNFYVGSKEDHLLYNSDNPELCEKRCVHGYVPDGLQCVALLQAFSVGIGELTKYSVVVLMTYLNTPGNEGEESRLFTWYVCEWYSCVVCMSMGTLIVSVDVYWVASYW